MTARVAFRGGTTCSCVVVMLPLLNAELRRRGLPEVSVYQLGYRTDVSASAGTHAAGGNTDVNSLSDAQIKVARSLGWTFQRRYRGQGFVPHTHGWPWGCPHLSAGGRAQAAQWRRRQNGLASAGRIEGPWPVPLWTDAVKAVKRRAQVAQQRAQQEAAAALAEARRKEDELPSIKQVTDSIIGRLAVPNGAPGDEVFVAGAGDRVSLVTAVLIAGKRLRGLAANAVDNQRRFDHLEADNTATKTQLDRIEAAVATLTQKDAS